MAGIAHTMYKIQKEYLKNILSYGWMGENSKLALIGGIMINCDGNCTDMFMPLSFDVISNKGSDKQALFERTFGKKS